VVRGSADTPADAVGCTLISTKDGKSEWRFAAADAFEISKARAFEIRVTRAGSGLGAFAVRGIKRGECMLSEAPLVQWTLLDGETTTAGLISRVNALSAADHTTYSNLCQNPMHGRGSKSAYGIWLSNAYPCTTPMQVARDQQNGVNTGSEIKAVFTTACRFNHSCSPNAHVAWNGSRGQQTIHALRDITPGEEICVSYLDNASGMPRTQRHDELGFACLCTACGLQGKLLAQSDKRRSRIGVIFGILESMIRATDRRAMTLVMERLQLMEQEGMREDWNTLYCAASFFGLTGDRCQAGQWAARAAESARYGMGEDSDEFIYYAASSAAFAKSSGR